MVESQPREVKSSGRIVSRDRLVVVAIVLFAVVVRVAACWALAGSLAEDPDAYAVIAETLAETGTFGLLQPGGDAQPTAFRPPLYPYLLSWLVVDGHLSQIAVACLHALLGGLTTYIAIVIGRRLVGGTGWFAGLLVAIDPILLSQSTLVMTETLAACLASGVLAWWVVYRDSARGSVFGFGLGVLIVLAFLCRPTFIVWGGLIGIGCLAFGSTASRLARASVFAAVVACGVAGWTVRNEYHFGQPIWATSHGGYTILLANNPMFYDYLRESSWGEAWDATQFFAAWEHRHEGDVTTPAFWATDWAKQKVPPAKQKVPPTNSPGPDQLVPPIKDAASGGAETSEDELAYAAAMATIRREPGMFVWSCFARVGQLWSPFPHQTPGRSSFLVIATSAYYVILYGLILVGLYRLGRQVFTPSWWAFWGLVVALSAVHSIYWSNLRMRSPAVAGMAVLASAALLPRRITLDPCAGEGSEVQP